MDPFEPALFLFCDSRADRIKSLMWDNDGFVLLYKRLDNGRYKWPRTENELKPRSWQQFLWLMEGLQVEQKLVIRPVPNGQFL